MKNYIIGGLVVVTIVLGFIAYKPSLTPSFGGLPVNWTVTNSNAVCGVSSGTLALAAYPAQYRSISNIGATVVYLWLSNQATSTNEATNTGYALQPSSTVDWKVPATAYQGNIYCMSSASDTITYVQY